jgi:VWFA-related protein
MRTHSRWTPLLLSFLFLSAAVGEQQPNRPSDGTKFVSRSQLVMVPVIVTDGKGRPVTGLSTDSFRIEENGKPQTVKVFEEVKTDAASAGAVRMKARSGFSNLVASDAQPRRVTILVLDLLNTPIKSQNRARKELIKYLAKSLDSSEPVTLLGISRKGLQQLHSFTTDTKLLIAALNRVSSRLSVQDMHGIDIQSPVAEPTDLSETDPLADDLASFLQDSSDTLQAFKDRDAARQTLTALNQIAQAYSGIPGRKTLVWASSGFPFMIDDPKAFAYMGTDMVDSYEQTWRTLTTQNIAVYPVDVEGLIAPELGVPALSPGISMSRRKGSNSQTVATRETPYDRHAEQMDTMRAFADATGGTACLNTNDLAKCFRQAVDDSRTYYLLGFYLASDDRTPGWRKLKVHVAAGGAHVRARDGFYVGNQSQNDEKTRKAALLAGLTSSLEFTGVAMNVRWTNRTKLQTIVKGVTTEKFSAGFVISLRPKSFVIDGADRVMSLDVAAIAFNGKGEPVAEFSRKVEQNLSVETMQRAVRDGLVFRETMHVPSGTTLVRFVVRDNNSGEMGSVNTQFESQGL